jgi:3-hydroxyacyl-CoA dehydrogenase/enoyl-CoA hydratase/carnithine racemase
MPQAWAVASTGGSHDNAEPRAANGYPDVHCTAGTGMSSIKLEKIRKDIVLMTLDMPGKGANVLTVEVWAELAQVCASLESDPPAGVVLYSAKPAIFVAGADLIRISKTLDWPDAEIIRFCEEGRAIMRTFSRIPSVTVAAVHGACVGGGMELTLWCDHRIASSDRKTRFGLPEVRLGLVPGWAGTVRLPRLIGLEPAVEMVTSGDTIDSARALELGLVTQVVPQSGLVDAAIGVIDEELRSGQFRKRRAAMQGPVATTFADQEACRKSARERIHGRNLDAAAPLVVLNQMVDTARLDHDAACDGESKAMARVYGSRENRGLLHWFFVDEQSRKLRGDRGGIQPPAVSRVAIIGAGQMGRRIADLCLAGGYSVSVYDADPGRRESIGREMSSAVKEERLMVAESLEQAVAADLIVESVVEKLSVKRSLFERIGQMVSDQTLLATNTSTIPVGDIVSTIPNPARMFGLHFCCPVEPLQLVEIVEGSVTSAAAMNAAIELVRKIRKTPAVVADRPGFVVNRLLCPVFNEALDLLLQGILQSDIDRAFREFGFAVGPLEMIDFIGVDTIMYAGETFLRTLPDLVSLNPVLPALVKRGRLGRKSGAGFYRYESALAEPVIDEELEKILDRYRNERISLTSAAIIDRLLNPMIAAGRKLLAEGVVSDARDVDLCSVLGTTFPQVRGGLMYWADELSGFWETGKRARS